MYKLSDEINDFLQERDYKIECPDFLAEDKEAEAEYPIIEIKIMMTLCVVGEI